MQQETDGLIQAILLFRVVEFIKGVYRVKFILSNRHFDDLKEITYLFSKNCNKKDSETPTRPLLN